MGEVKAGAQRTIAAPVEQVYAIVSDPGRRREFLPDAYADVTVSGDPAVVSYRLHAGGRQREYQMRQQPGSEPHGWREDDQLSTLVTRWKLTPRDAGSTTVDIATTWQGAGGVGGFFEKTFAPRAVGRLHGQTLERLKALAEAGG